MKKDKLAILLPNLVGGGAERISVNLANALAARGYEVDMVLLSATGQYLELVNPGVRLVDLKVARMRGLLLPLIGYLKGNKPDAMLACMWPITVLALISQKIALVKTKIVVAEHITWSAEQIRYSYIKRFLIRFSMRLFFPSAKGIVAVSSDAADDFSVFSGIARKSISMIYNPVVGSAVLHSRTIEYSHVNRWNAGTLRVLNVGSLKDQKNQELLIRAFAILLNSVNAQLAILGEGALRPRLEALIEELGIRDNVVMPGFVEDPTVFYQNSNLFVLSSDWEGLPTVLIEALACGTPIVSTDCPSGPREILCDGRFGSLVPVGDIEALAASMLKALSVEHDHSALVKRAQDFAIDIAVDKYEALLVSK